MAPLKNVRMKKDVHPAVRREYGRLWTVEKREKDRPENAGKRVVFDYKRRVVLVGEEIVDSFKLSFF